MSDKEDHHDAPIYYVEGSETVFEQPLRGEDGARRRRYSEQQKFEREQVRANKRIIACAGILAIASVLSTVIVLWQASISQKAASAAQDAAKAANDVVAEMRRASDTPPIQPAAMQAGQTVSPAKSTELRGNELRASEPRVNELRAKQPDSAPLSGFRHAEIAAKPASISQAQDLPYLVLENLDLAEPIVAGKPTRLQDTFLNAGSSPAVDVHSLFRSDSFIDGSTPPYEFRGVAQSQVLVAAKSTFNSPMALSPLTDVQIQQFDEGIRRIFLTGELIYSDFRHAVHHTYFCFELNPRDRKMYPCRNEKPSD